jgi:hypothetical protein
MLFLSKLLQGSGFQSTAVSTSLHQNATETSCLGAEERGVTAGEEKPDRRKDTQNFLFSAALTRCTADLVSRSIKIRYCHTSISILNMTFFEPGFC